MEKGPSNGTVRGADLKNPEIHTSNFLIEAYFRTAAGLKDATLVQKMRNAGYALRINEAGGVTLAAARLASRRAWPAIAPSTMAGGTT